MSNHVFPTYTWAEVPHYASDTVLMFSLKRMKRSHHFFPWTAEARFVCKLIIVAALMFGVRVVHAQRTTLLEVVSFGKIGAHPRNGGTLGGETHVLSIFTEGKWRTVWNVCRHIDVVQF